MCIQSVAAVALAGLLTIAASARAMADESDRVSATVTLSDLDLKTPAGAQAARDRIRKEALRLCRRFSDERRISYRETLADCVRQAEHEVGDVCVVLRCSPSR